MYRYYDYDYYTENEDLVSEEEKRDVLKQIITQSTENVSIFDNI